MWRLSRGRGCRVRDDLATEQQTCPASQAISFLSKEEPPPPLCEAVQRKREYTDSGSLWQSDPALPPSYSLTSGTFLNLPVPQIPLCEWKSHRILQEVWWGLLLSSTRNSSAWHWWMPRKHQPRSPMSRQDLVQCHPSMWHSTNASAGLRPLWWTSAFCSVLFSTSFSFHWESLSRQPMRDQRTTLWWTVPFFARVCVTSQVAGLSLLDQGSPW